MGGGTFTVGTYFWMFQLTLEHPITYCKVFLNLRSDLIFLIFDPTKLDVGSELENLFKQLKGKESALRIILNKADSLDEQELMRVYGALFWALSPLINVTEAPRIYVGSFWSNLYKDKELGELLLSEETSLLKDMYEVIRNRIYMKIAFLRQYAIRVRIHAYLVDSYVSAYKKHKGYFVEDEQLAVNIAGDPETYNVFKLVLANPNISEYDLPQAEEYEDFFRINPLIEQPRIGDVCTYFSKKCILDELNYAINHDLPALLQNYQIADAGQGYCTRKTDGGPCVSEEPSFMTAAKQKYRKQFAAPKKGEKQEKTSSKSEKTTKPQQKWRKST